MDFVQPIIETFGVREDPTTIGRTYADSVGQFQWYQTTRCLDCGADTVVDGYVNRVTSSRRVGDREVDAFSCGPCVETFDSGHDADDDQFDGWEALEAYLPARTTEVDKVDPGAAAFRHWLDTGEILKGYKYEGNDYALSQPTRTE